MINDGIIRLLQSDDYKERLQGEYLELSERIGKLNRMIKSHEEGTLNFIPDTPISLLELQYEVMMEYRNILKKRADIEGIKIVYVECIAEDLSEE